MPSQLFNLKRYFGGKDATHREENTIVSQDIPTQSLESPLTTPLDPAKRQDLSLLTHFSQRLNSVLAQAVMEATKNHQAFIETEHLLFGLLYDSTIFKVISEMTIISPANLQQEIVKNETVGTSSTTPQFSNTVKAIFEKAWEEAKTRGEEFITPEHVLFAIVDQGDSKAASLLSQNNVTKTSLERKLPSNLPTVKTNTSLETYGVDLTKKAYDNMLDPVVGRQNEIERMIHILSRRTKNNPVLVGEAGVGKTAIVEGLAQRIIQKTIPLDLQNKRIVALDLASLIAGASHRGEFEERLKGLIKELQIARGEVILFIDEVHNLVGAGSGEGTLDASNILKPFLARGEIQLIGTSTIDEYRRYIEKDPALERRFQQVLIEEPSLEQALEMLKGIRQKYENFHNVKISDDALSASVKLSKQYIGDRFLPDKAIDVLDEAASKIRLNVKDTSPALVTPDVIEEVISSWTGIPISKLTETESQRLLNLEIAIHKRLVDQEGAVSAIAQAIRRGRAGLKSTNRPIGSFLFMGPTGVGKTELAKALAWVLFGSEGLMIRLDMSEYMEKHEVAKLIGAPPGYVGYEEGGQLVHAVRTKPYSVILLDEIEKAHPDVFNILIQILEDGRLTDNKGRTVSFKNTIIIATSNIATSLIQKEDLQNFGKQTISLQSGSTFPNGDTSTKPLSQKLLEELQKFFKPEVLNRFDEIIVFKPLSSEHMQEIAILGIDSVKRLLAQQKIGLEITTTALSQLAKLGFDSIFGARPLRRAIQTYIENPLSTLLIQKAFREGDVISIDFDDIKNNFTFTKKVIQTLENQPQTASPINLPSAITQNSNNQPLPPTTSGTV